jgi:hypothetical protein
MHLSTFNIESCLAMAFPNLNSCSIFFFLIFLGTH